jgi:hypothetical protein
MGDNEEMPCKAIRKMKILQKGVEIYQLFNNLEKKVTGETMHASAKIY